jgi:hypothetical protein
MSVLRVILKEGMNDRDVSREMKLEQHALAKHDSHPSDGST